MPSGSEPDKAPTRVLTALFSATLAFDRAISVGASLTLPIAMVKSCRR